MSYRVLASCLYVKIINYISGDLCAAVAEGGGGGAEAFLELPGEGGVIREAALVAELRNGNVGGGQQALCQQEPFAVDVLMDAEAGVSLELAHHVELAEIGCFCQGVNGQVIGEVAVDVGKDLLDFPVAGNAGKLQLVVQNGPVQEYHKFHEQHFGVQLVAVALLVGNCFQLVHVKQQVVAFAGRRMHDAGGLPCGVKALGKVAFALSALGEKIRRDVDDNPFVAFAGHSNGAMDFTGTDEKNIPWFQGVGPSFDDVGGFAPQEQDDFVEIVVVKGDFLQGGILEAEDAEALQKIPFFIVFIHGDCSLFFMKLVICSVSDFKYYRTFFAILTALFIYSM